MGFANRAFPFFSSVDGFLANVFSPTACLVIWGIMLGVVSMVLYRFLSSQQRIAQCKNRLTKVRQEISGFEGDFAEVLPLLGNQLSLSFKHVALTMWPASVASIPLLFLLAWFGVERSYMTPLPGEPIDVEASPATIAVTWSVDAETLGTGKSRVVWPPGDRLVAHVEGDEESILVPIEMAMPVIHKRKWWNALIGNPAGYIPDGTSIDKLHFMLTPTRFLPIGPAWMRGWELTFFSALVLTSILIKVVFRIN